MQFIKNWYSYNESDENSKPEIFSYTTYDLPREEDLIDVNQYGLPAEEILNGFYYTIVGRGILSEKNRKMIIEAIARLCQMYPDNEEYKKALIKANDLKSKEYGN